MASKRTTSHGLEIDRIIALAVTPEFSDLELEEFARMEVRADKFGAGFRPFKTQAAAVLAYDILQGGLHPIGVGWGKTLISLMIAQRAHRKGHKSLLLLPSDVYPQLTQHDIQWARARVDLTVPFHYMGGKSSTERGMIARSGKKGCYIMPYSCLSTKDTTEVLNAIAPDTVICDEGHNLKNRDAARTKRLMHYFHDQEVLGRLIELVVLSGTITKKSIRDYHHLANIALRFNSPLPISNSLADQWAMVLDAEADPSDANLGPIRPLVDWAQLHFPGHKLAPHVAGFREAYKLRLNSAPGVVGTGDAEIGTSLTIANSPIPKYEHAPGWTDLKKKITDVEELWLSPSGDEIDYAFHQWRFLWELNSGFYYKLVWPTPAELVEKKRMTEGEATAFLELAKIHHSKHQVYNKFLRTWLRENYIPGLDTPMLVGKALSVGDLPRRSQELYEAWLDMKNAEYPDMPERYSEPVRICDFKIEAAVDWAEQLPSGTGALLWVYHQEIGEWLYERLRDLGADVLHCPAGAAANTAIVDPKNSKKLLVASLTAHSTGKNLQFLQEQRYVQWPRDASMAEQSLGRTHRNGQLADALTVSTSHTTPFDHQNFCACLIDSLYLHQTVGSRQKLIYANYDPLPMIYPGDFLRERGFNNRLLTQTEQEVMAEKFGSGLAPGR